MAALMLDDVDARPERRRQPIAGERVGHRTFADEAAFAEYDEPIRRIKRM
jgi:hypothetical protein